MSGFFYAHTERSNASTMGLIGLGVPSPDGYVLGSMAFAGVLRSAANGNRHFVVAERVLEAQLP